MALWSKGICLAILTAALSVGTTGAIDKADVSKRIPEYSRIIPAYSEESVKAKLEELDVQPIEGVWYYNEEQTTLAIERCEQSIDDKAFSYRIVYLESSAYDVLPGTVIGYIEDSVDPKKFALWIYCERDKLALRKPVKCVATISADGSVLTFEKPKLKIKFRANVARFLPTLFKGISIIPELKEEQLPVGFKKIFPEADDNHTGHHKVRYL